MTTESIFNFIKISANVGTGGQPTREQLEAARDEGYEAVVNLAPHSKESHALPDERGLVQSLGMEYQHIPVEWTRPLKENYVTFAQAMEGIGDKKVLIHCAANFRVSAFYSLYAMSYEGWSAEQADELIAKIWESRPDYRMDEIWRTFIDEMRQFK